MDRVGFDSFTLVRLVAYQRENRVARIVVCEVDKRGVEHVFFNAAALETILLAYPEDTVLFQAERTHWDAVRAVRDSFGVADGGRLEWEEIEVPAPRTGFFDVLRHERTWTRRLQEAVRRDCRLAFVCSVTDSGLLALKLSMLAGRIRCPVIAVPHSPLASLALFQSPRWWRRVINLRGVLRLPHPAKLRLIALGDSIFANVKTYAPRLAYQFRSFDHPYFWVRNDADLTRPPQLRFGFLGVAGRNKGFDDFYKLAEVIASEYPEVEFELAGYLRTEDEIANFGSAVSGMGTIPLGPAQFRERVEPLTYVVWTGDPAHYELTASATFLDTLSYVKPGIFYRNAFVGSYFERLGDIGYMCEGFDDVLGTIREICSQFPAQRYRQQCENILRGRSLFDPATQAPKLRRIVAELSGDSADS